MQPVNTKRKLGFKYEVWFTNTKLGTGAVNAAEKIAADSRRGAGRDG